MQVGDLVELSAYGKKLKCFASRRGLVGVVVKNYGGYNAAIHVQWISLVRPERMLRRDLKIAK